MKISLVIPTLNEYGGMKVIMPQIDRSMFDQIIVLDGGSTDGTIEYCKEHGYELYIQKKKGVRFAYIEALPLITGDAIITFSPDGNCRAEDLAPLIKEFTEGNYDLVIASRYLDGAKSDDDGALTTFGNWFFTGLCNTLFGYKYTDAMTIFRMYKKQLVYDLELEQDKSYTTFEKMFFTITSWEPMMSARAAKRKLKIGETLGYEPARIAGKAKLQPVRWGLCFLFQFLRDFLFWK